MNVLVLSMRGPTDEDRRGGAQEYIRHIFAQWVKRGDRVRVICMQEKTRGGILPRNECVDGIEVIRVGGRHDVERLLGVVQRARASQTWADLMVENIMAVPLLPPLWKESGLPFLAIKHHLQGHTFFEREDWIEAFIGLFMERFSFPVVYRNVPLVVNSERTKQDLRDLWLGRWEELQVVPPGVERISTAAEKFERPTILYLGSLHLARKRIDDLLEAFRETHQACPEAQLIVAGDGPDREYLQDQASDLPVTFTGFVSKKRKHRLLEKAWVFASPSTKEGFGITWIEANACGVPVVGYDLGLDTVTPSCSIMVPPRDKKALSRGLTKLLQNPEEREEMADAARENAERFNWERSSERFRQFAEQVLEIDEAAA